MLVRDNNAFGSREWPDDVAHLELAKQTWIFQNSTRKYLEVGKKTPGLHVLLVFVRYNHVQPAEDKPHIHHAYDGSSPGAKL